MSSRSMFISGSKSSKGTRGLSNSLVAELSECDSKLNESSSVSKNNLNHPSSEKELVGEGMGELVGDMGEIDGARSLYLELTLHLLYKDLLHKNILL